MATNRPIAEHEIQRILALVPWLVAHPGSTRQEITERFGISEAQLDRDLDLMLMVGVPPYTPGDYIDVDDDGETVTLRMADSFRRPPRLTAPEGLAVLAAGRALLAVPGSDPDGPLASALDKLAAALGNPDVSVSIGAPAFLDTVRHATDVGHELVIDYWTAGRDVTTQRTVQPHAVFYAAGAWYLEAFCHLAQNDRLFRVDRIRAAEETTTTFATDATRETRALIYQPRPEDPEVVLEVTAAARWVGEYYPVTNIEDLDHGAQRITMTVSEPVFLERLLLRLGPDATVVSGLDPKVFSASLTAARVLARYGATGQ